MHFLKKIWRWLHHFLTSNYSFLLFFLVFLFVFRPSDMTTRTYTTVWKVFFLGTILSAIFNCKHKMAVRIIVALLAIPSIGFTWVSIYSSSEFVAIAIPAATFLFLTICTGSILYDVVLRARVTMETLRGVICAYFMIAFAFAYAYRVIEFLDPNSFSIEALAGVVSPSWSFYFSELVYFSFVTLLTIGYGDIVALKQTAQTVCVIEGIIGQFYIAILVARLVSVYSFYSDKRLLHAIEKDIDKQ